MKKHHRRALMVLFAGAFACLGGCASYKANFAGAYKQGSYVQAEQEVVSEGQNAVTHEGNGDHLIYLLEEGTVLRTNGKLDESNKAFDAADAYFAKIDQKPYVRVGREAYAAVSSLAELSYEGYGYDRIMTNAYKALNYMEQGNMDFARAELKRVAYVQDHIQRHKDKQIKELQDAKNDNSGDSAYDVNRAMNDPRFQAQANSVYGSLPDNKARAVYVNAFAEYLQGIFYLNDGDPSDIEVGHAAMKRAASMVDNSYVRQDLELAEQMRNGQKAPPLTYIIFESGMAPRREEIRIDIPVFIYNLAIHDTGVDYVGAAFPKLVEEPGGLSGINARTSAGVYPTQLLVDMDNVVGKEFRDDLPAVITRTLIAAGTKAALAYVANRATQKTDSNGIVNILTRVATTVYQYVSTNADLRTWRTLPKMIVISRFPTPTDGNVTITTPQGGVIATAAVNPNATNIIWVRGPSDFSPFVYRSFALGAKSQTTNAAAVNGNAVIGQK